MNSLPENSIPNLNEIPIIEVENDKTTDEIEKEVQINIKQKVDQIINSKSKKSA